MKKLFIAVVASVILMGCASAPNISPVYVKSQVIHTPPINIESEAEIGQTISSKANLAIYPAISISQDISERIQVSLSSNAWSGVTTIHSGIFSKTFESPEGSFFVDPQGIFVYLMGTVPCLCGVFIPNNAANSPL